jgi:hypothetical protein
MAIFNNAKVSVSQVVKSFVNNTQIISIILSYQSSMNNKRVRLLIYFQGMSKSIIASKNCPTIKIVIVGRGVVT